MTNQNNNAGITDDDIKKAEAYKNALDALKASIIGVNSKLPEFADGIKDGLKALGEKLPEVVDAMQKLNAQNKELAASGQQPKSILKELASSMFSWNSIISVGITLLASYADVIIDWVSDMIKGQTTLSALGKAMKDNTIIMEALTRSRLTGEKNAQQELVHLKLLYTATQNQTLSLNERKKAINEIKDLYPDYFKGISDETILASGATEQYNKLSDAIIASARARAAEDIMIKNQVRYLGNNDKLKTLAPQLENINKELNAAIKSNKEINQMQITGGSTLAVGTGSRDTAGDAKITRLTNQSDELKKTIADIKTDSKLLDGQNEVLIKSVSDYTEKYGTKVITGLQKNNEQLNKHLSHASKKQVEANVDNEKVYHDFLIKQLQDTANAFAKAAVLEHSNYAGEQAALKRLLDDKLISQQQYQDESEKLEAKYHVNIGNITKRMNEDDLNKIQKQQKDLIDTQTQNKLINADQHDVDKALPWNKLDAEKKLITDKYNFEIQKAAEAGKDTAEIRKQYEQEITDTTKQFEQQRKDFAIQTTQQVSSAAFSIIGNSIKSQTDAKIKGLENDKAQELSNKNLTNTQKQAIEQKYKQKENQAKLKAFKDEQKLSLAQALINGALAITKVTSQTGVLAPFVIPGIIAETAIQVAAILKQKPPAFAKGGHFVSDGRGALLSGYSRTDNTNAYLRSGEAVVVSEAMRNPWARNLVSAINVAHGGRDFSIPNPGRGYAIGGIFTDGGNANRYYNQPVNDAKDLANTLAYQMINNFPPVYVDVKDINNQQNILAQTINRVNL